MAQNYEIDIKRFNGQDYDTLLPTPASHASTHQADGSDPLTLQAGNYGALSIPTSAYQNASVSRAKLAQDALYSPIKDNISGTYYLSISDIGKTLKTSYNAAVAITITQENSNQMPFGAEIAVLSNSNKAGLTTIVASGTRFMLPGETSVLKDKTIEISVPYGMIALKKVNSSSTDGNIWLVTGNVEVV